MRFLVLKSVIGNLNTVKVSKQPIHEKTHTACTHKHCRQHRTSLWLWCHNYTVPTLSNFPSKASRGTEETWRTDPAVEAQSCSSYGLVPKMYPRFYSPFFHNVSLWEEVFLGHNASGDIIITRFGHYESCLQSLVPFLGAWQCPYGTVRADQSEQTWLFQEAGRAE